MAQYLDVSLPIHSGMMVYKNKVEKQPQLKVMDTLHQGGSYETILTMNLHTGTHLDFPLHMKRDGINSNSLNVTELIRPIRVVDCGNAKVIDATLLKSFSLKPGDFIFLKTRNSEVDHFLMDFTYLSEEGAKYCVEKKLRGIGIDALGIERDQKDHPTHHILMNAGILILEGLRLKDVSAGIYKMLALPLSIPGVDALPVRVLLERNP